MNCLFYTTASALIQSHESSNLHGASLAILPEKSARERERYGPPHVLTQLASQHDIYLVLDESSERTILSTMAPYAGLRLKGTIPTFIKAGADIERLHTILSVFEAEHGLQDESLHIIAELGKYPIIFNQTVGLIQSSPRLTTLTWNEEALKVALNAKRTRDDQGTLLSPFLFAQTQCLFAARSAHLNALDSTSPYINERTARTKDCSEAKQLGFDGKWTCAPDDIRIIEKTFVSQVQ